MKKRIFSLLLILGLFLYACGGLASGNTAAAARIDGKTADRVHLREQPFAAAKSLGLYFTGTEVQYDANASGEWTWVTIGSESGYIKSEYLYWGNNPSGIASQQPIGIVKTSSAGSAVNLRSAPSIKASVTATVFGGDSIIILGETATKWYYVKADHTFGYISAQFLQTGAADSPTHPPPQGQAGGITSNQAAIDALISVMQNKTAFIRAYDQQYVNLSQLVASAADVPVQITQFAVIDLDDDGLREVILRETIDAQEYGFFVLHYQDNVVYGFELAYRAMTDLKADGTFYYSSGAADNGIGKLWFCKDAYRIEGITYCQSGNDANHNKGSFYVDHAPSTLDGYRRAVDKWDDRLAAMWYDFSGSNINAVLSQYK